MKKSLTAVAAICLGLSACGGGDSSSGASDGPITIYQIAPIESQAVSVPMMKTSAEAAVSAVNDAGGVDGRKLKLVVCNDKADPNESLRCAQKAVRAKAAAVVGSLSLFGAQILPILAKANVAYIHPVNVTPADTSSKNSFVLNQGTLAYASQPEAAKKLLGAEKVAVIQDESPASASNSVFFNLGAKKAGVEIVADVQIPLDAVDYTQYIARAEAKGATALLMTPTAEHTLKMWKALESSGSKLKLVFSSEALGPETAKAAGPVSNGSVAVGGAPLPADTNEFGKAYLADMTKYQPQEKIYSGVGFTAWSAVYLFADVAKTIDGPVDSESVLEAFSTLDGLKFMWLDSLSFDKPGPYAEAPQLASTTIYTSVVKDGTFAPEEPFDIFAK